MAVEAIGGRVATVRPAAENGPSRQVDSEKLSSFHDGRQADVVDAIPEALEGAVATAASEGWDCGICGNAIHIGQSYATCEKPGNAGRYHLDHFSVEQGRELSSQGRVSIRQVGEGSG